MAETFVSRGRLYRLEVDRYSNIPHLRIMSGSLSRRACYKCGNVGHYAGMGDNAWVMGKAAHERY